MEIVQSEIFLNAFWSGSVTAILCATVGYFMVLRSLAFASEALTDIGFAGATGSALFGWNPLFGMIGLGMLAVFSIGALREKLKGRDVEVGMVLSFSLGLGVLFLSLHAHSSASHASSGIGVLFGSLLSISGSTLLIITGITVLVMIVLGILFRPLLFASVDPETARAKGIPVRTLDLGFLLILAATTAVSIQAMGVLLAFALLSAPAGAALKLTRNRHLALLLSVVFGLGISWSGIMLTFFGPFPRVPIGFYIATFSALLYAAALFRDSFRTRSQAIPHHHHQEKETR